MRRLVILLALLHLSSAAKHYFITAPNVFRANVEEDVLVSVFGTGAASILVTVKLTTSDNIQLGSHLVSVKAGTPKIVRFTVDPALLPSDEDIPTLAIQAYSLDPILTFDKTVYALATTNNQVVFIQTDKPIYTPDQEVKIRLTYLNEAMKPTDSKIRLDIITPTGAIIDRQEDLNSDQIEHTGYLTYVFQFSSYPTIGIWSVVASYGKDNEWKRTIEFELREYVLPTFEVKLEGQKQILKSDNVLSATVTARYVYNKDVRGTAQVTMSVVKGGATIATFDPIAKLLNGQGQAVFNIDPADHSKGWFDEFEGARLKIEAVVTERATGDRENTSISDAKFVRRVYTFNRHRTVSHYKKGTTFDIKIDLYHSDGTPGIDVLTEVEAYGISPDGTRKKLTGHAEFLLERTSNQLGQVDFRVDVNQDTESISVTIKTLDDDYPDEANGLYEFTLSPISSESGAYLQLRIPPGELPVTNNFEAEVVKSGAVHVVGYNFIVVVRGKIVQPFSDEDTVLGAQKTIRFDITPDMVPSARLIIYSFVNGGIVADSILLDIVEQCKSQLIVRVDDPTLKPSQDVYIDLIAAPQTHVSLLAVDEAVYFLKDFHRLTRKKMFQRMESLDLGCGPGGGANSREVFENAGLTAVTDANFHNNFKTTDIREGYGCPTLTERRRKRALNENSQSCYDDFKSNEALCKACEDGFVHIPKKTCAQRIRKYSKRKGFAIPEDLGNPPDVTKLDPVVAVFYNCCLSKEEERNVIAGRVGDAEVDIEEDEGLVNVRSHFPETWISFDDYTIPDSGLLKVQRTVPDSITNWIVQASSVSASMGMCVADEKDIEVSKDVFLQLKMPYSIVKGEQAQVQATLFNYGGGDISANVYMYGTEDVCSESDFGARGPRHRLNVPSYDAATTTFNIIPLKIGTFEIVVKAFTNAENDGVEKMIRVVAEGVERYHTKTILIDPTGEREGVLEEGELEEEDVPLENEFQIKPVTHRDKVEQTQSDAIDIQVADVDAIPGTEHCFLTFFGDVMTPAVSAVIDGFDPFSLFQAPNGCAEQTLMRMSPNVYTMLYLTHTDQVEAEVEKKAYTLIQDSYKRMVGFQVVNGGFAVWGNIHAAYPPSTWLTAYTIRVFYEASELGSHVDKGKLCEAFIFLGDRYEDVAAGQGKFYEGYNARHWEMTGGISGDFMMTAFVIITIKQSDPANLKKEPRQCGVDYSVKITRAVAYLEANIDNLDTPYARAVVSYALNVAGSAKADELWANLKTEASFDVNKGLRHWTMATSTLTIEATSYALLTALYRNEIVYANGMVNWLTEHGDYRRGWGTTSSTGIAFEALATYASGTATAQVELTCKVKSTAKNTVEETIDINNANKDLSQRVKCQVNGLLHIKCKGQGVAQAQIEVVYNSPASTKEAECDFLIQVGMVKKEVDGRDDIYTLTTTTKYRKVLNGRTNMAIVEVGIISGYKPVEDTLKSLVNNNELRVDRYEIADRKVVLYLTYLTTEPTTLRFDVVEEFPVVNVQSSGVIVYDYYSPERKCTKFYNPHDDQAVLRQFCEDGLCRCAAGACPMCPHGVLPTGNELYNDYACGTDPDTAQDYVFEVIALGKVQRNGFVELTASVLTVMKEGSDEFNDRSNGGAVQRTFVMKTSCTACNNWIIGQKYLLMGQDGIRHKPEGTNVFVYKYLLGSTSYIEKWPKRSDNKKRAKELKQLKTTLTTDKCPL